MEVKIGKHDEKTMHQFVRTTQNTHACTVDLTVQVWSVLFVMVKIKFINLM